jgi:sugar phosphate isomerase/epimerase
LNRRTRTGRISSTAPRSGPGPTTYAEHPVPFDEVGPRLAELGFDGLGLGGFNGYPNPNALPHKEQRAALKEKARAAGASR